VQSTTKTTDVVLASATRPQSPLAVDAASLLLLLFAPATGAAMVVEDDEDASIISPTGREPPV
jgi:hypothetical protein